MNNPNPLVPQGSLLEQKGKGKPHLRIAIFIVAIHVVFLGGLLMQGCKRDTPPTTASLAPTNDIVLPPLDTNITGIVSPPDTNLPPLGSPAPSGVAGLPVPEPYPSTATPGTPAPLAPAMTEAPAGGTTPYVIRKGDTLGLIAKKNKITLRALNDANPGLDPTKLKLGQTIHLPAMAAPGGATAAIDPNAATPAPAPSSTATATYAVKSGDTLTRIAKTHGITVKELRTLNKLKTDRINVGQKLKVPGGQAPAMSAEPVPGGGLLSPEPTGGAAPQGVAPVTGFQPIPAAGQTAGAPPR